MPRVSKEWTACLLNAWPEYVSLIEHNFFLTFRNDQSTYAVLEPPRCGAVRAFVSRFSRFKTI